MIHGLVVAGAIRRFEGDPAEIATRLSDFEAAGTTARYLFGAASDEEFIWKERKAAGQPRKRPRLQRDHGQGDRI
jgi:hypothetical protein